jgi:hypothetical protein
MPFKKRQQTHSSLLHTRFTYLMWTVFSVVYSVVCIVLWHCTTLCYSFFLICCTVQFSCIEPCLLAMYVLLPWLRVFRAFSSVVRQMSGYNSQRRSTARTSQISFKFFIDMYVPLSVFCVLFVCKCVMYYCYRVSTQLQLNIYHVISYTKKIQTCIRLYHYYLPPPK